MILAASLLSAEAGRSLLLVGKVLVIVEVAGAADRGFHGPKVCDAAVADRYAIESERDRVGGGLRIRSSASIPVVEMGVLRNTEIFSALPAASLERGCA